MGNKTVEHELPFVRFLRWDDKPLKNEPIAVAVAQEHTFVISVSPAGSSAGYFRAIWVNIGTGDVGNITLTKVGANSLGGQLFRGTIPARTLSANLAYLIRFTDNRNNAACEIEIATKRRG